MKLLAATCGFTLAWLVAHLILVNWVADRTGTATFRQAISTILGLALAGLIYATLSVLERSGK